MFSPPFSAKDPGATRRKSQPLFLCLSFRVSADPKNDWQVTGVPYWFFAPVTLAAPAH